MVEAGVSEPVVIDWASPVISVPSEDGCLISCLEYRRHSTAAIRDSYVIPHMDKGTVMLAEAQVLPKLDANSGY